MFYVFFLHHIIFTFILLFHIFTALRGMQTRSSDENSVRPSIRLSVTHVDRDKTVERSVQIYIPHERSFSLKNDWWGGDPIYLKFWIKVTALERNRRLPIYFRS